MPLYQFECPFGHIYDAIRPLSHSGREACEECGSASPGFARRVIARTSVHIPGRSVARKFETETMDFANKQTRIAEAKSRKVQPLR